MAPRVLKIFTNGLLQSLHISSGYKLIEPDFLFLTSFMKKKFGMKNEFSNPKKTTFLTVRTILQVCEDKNQKSGSISL